MWPYVCLPVESSFSYSFTNAVNTDLVSDTTPQLGGNLDVNTKNILRRLVAARNATIEDQRAFITNLQRTLQRSPVPGAGGSRRRRRRRRRRRCRK